MARVCVVSGAGPQAGRKYKRRGMVRRKGGAGSKIVGKTLRVIKPNLQRIKIIDEKGTVRYALVSARMIKAGKIVKAGKASVKRAAAASKV
ncbi:MAG: 50S ribosomal protein L28 [Candidatus Omnitrophica bacterium]|nr:50S ribosomal protein L28 [Candidatus Omnitrophota bacterium]